uniref:Uncharacterized protein n=1 Tax=Glossina pallidipes TaxID=7398 RepID=A0A1A9Z4I5_GLOPL
MPASNQLPDILQQQSELEAAMMLCAKCLAIGLVAAKLFLFVVYGIQCSVVHIPLCLDSIVVHITDCYCRCSKDPQDLIFILCNSLISPSMTILIYPNCMKTYLRVDKGKDDANKMNNPKNNKPTLMFTPQTHQKHYMRSTLRNTK